MLRIIYDIPKPPQLYLLPHLVFISSFNTLPLTEKEAKTNHFRPSLLQFVAPRSFSRKRSKKRCSATQNSITVVYLLQFVAAIFLFQKSKQIVASQSHFRLSSASICHVMFFFFQKKKQKALFCYAESYYCRLSGSIRDRARLFQKKKQNALFCCANIAISFHLSCCVLFPGKEGRGVVLVPKKHLPKTSAKRNHGGLGASPQLEPLT
jgi:hypothetical protein